MTVLFWASAIALFYSLFGYGMLLLALSRLRPRRTPPAGPGDPPNVSFLVAAYNEAPVIADKVENTLALNTGGADIELIVVSDGSADETAEIVRKVDDPRITVLEPGRVGKAQALAQGLKCCTGDIVVFSDANAILEKNSLTAMLRHYADPEVGGVCGQITVEGKSGGIGFAESLFWRYDQQLKHAESRLGGAISAQGSVYSLRRALVRPPAPGCTDDFVISVGAVAQGYRLVFEPDASTVENVTENVGNEMRRRIRSSERGWRSLLQNAGLMNPLRHGWYAWQLFSHKLMRRLNPFFLILLFVSNLALMGQNLFYLATGLFQIAFYGVAAAGLVWPHLRRNKLVALPAFFTFAHIALLIGILRCLFGRQSVLWTPSRDAG
ncbi:MAG: glycosyltransferase [Paracoccus sp. (in: a-proteobacteria)]|uniref:glycosyltransferase family 2 protein n=1 Tax=unclassified Paracoccus (in: a-proteobacteria) TaxID=2688777 RepID=UPI000C60FDAF|nr:MULTISPECIES: glycosyltransferase [unclassified Paracoccus (in: a-proteobacteria)]MBA49934.1 glycosyl transferase, group 1 [Paracoccus sp. (in: a-proteobacteria)]HIC67354.1 glycosyltransferase [Paracoccus sp. (in: a-proteobacteria)]|tara:strand:- start:359 stop:1501 length:1143 start_codon:yes stop_codon:yes gene_type:complete